MSELSILQALVNAGMTVEAACAMAGNMMAESGLKANIAQRGMTTLSDEEYTERADNCCIPPEAGQPTIDFNNDGVGYGLCQWTYPTRKRDLAHFAARRGKSVGDEQTQVEYCIEELKNDFPELWAYLCETHDGYVATERICREYERPAVNNIEIRAKYAAEMYEKYARVLTDGTVKHPKPVDSGRTPESVYLASMLYALGYDVLWEGLRACVKDFQQKTGLEVDGICAEKTWAKIMGAAHG